MSKNSHYTYNYFQPEDYRFSLDSVFLAQKVAKLLSNSPLNDFKVLDLCAGCGIIGLELSLHSNKCMKIDFLEVQKIYQTYFEKNVNLIYPDLENALSQYQFLNLNYQETLISKFENTYDLIVCNPPYFFIDEGLLSPSEFKNRCRFFIDSDFKTLIQCVLHVLKPDKCAYLLVRSGVHHGRNPLLEIKSLISRSATAQIIDDVRGTLVIEIRKKISEIC